MDSHPVTWIIGGIGLVVLILLTVTGLSCSVYILEPNEYDYLKLLYELAKVKKIC